MGGIVVFYSICGAIIVALLIRIWFKNRAAKLNSQPARRSATPRSADKAVERSKPVSAAIAAEANSEAPTGSSVPIPASSNLIAAETSASSNTYVPPSYSVIPSTYVPAESSQILRSPEIATWEDRRLLEQYGGTSRGSKDGMPRVLAADVPGIDDSDRTFGTLLNPALASLLPDTDERRETARRELLAAGYYSPHALENLAALRYSLMMLSIVVFGGLLLIVPRRMEPWVIAGLIAGPIVGWAFPMLYVRRKAADRIHQISRAMPDLLDMLNMCVSQGLTVPDALKRILRDFRGIYPALSQELSIVTEQSQITDLHTALDSFGKRIDLPEVHSFTSLLVQTERMGTSISEALTTYSDTMRESLKQRADEKGNRATFRLLFPTVLCLMPAVYLFLLGPAVNELSRFFNAGGRDSLDSGTSAIQRMNAQRATPIRP